MKESNWKIFMEVCEYLANPVGHDRLNVYLHRSRMENNLLYKDNKLWVDKNLHLDNIQEVHDQPAVEYAKTRMWELYLTLI